MAQIAANYLAIGSIVVDPASAAVLQREIRSTSPAWDLLGELTGEVLARFTGVEPTGVGWLVFGAVVSIAYAKESQADPRTDVVNAAKRFVDLASGADDDFGGKGLCDAAVDWLRAQTADRENAIDSRMADHARLLASA